MVHAWLAVLGTVDGIAFSKLDFSQLMELVDLPADERVVIRVGVCGEKSPPPVDAGSKGIVVFLGRTLIMIQRDLGRERTMAMEGKTVNQCSGSANFLMSDRGIPIDSIIWNWYVNPVDLATILPFFAFDLSVGPAAKLVSLSLSLSTSAAASSAWTSSKRSKSGPKSSISRMILSAEAYGCFLDEVRLGDKGRTLMGIPVTWKP